jgi:hypothetical protein
MSTKVEVPFVTTLRETTGQVVEIGPWNTSGVKFKDEVGWVYHSWWATLYKGSDWGQLLSREEEAEPKEDACQSCGHSKPRERNRFRRKVRVTLDPFATLFSDNKHREPSVLRFLLRSAVKALCESGEVHVARVDGVAMGFICTNKARTVIHYMFVDHKYEGFGILRYMLTELGFDPDRQVRLSFETSALRKLQRAGKLSALWKYDRGAIREALDSGPWFDSNPEPLSREVQTDDC